VRIHSSHLGREGCLRRARECLFWPNMSSELKDYVASCSICREYETANANETLMPHEIPERPWSKVGTDLFSLYGKDFLITVDYLSSFFEIDRLQSTTSEAVIKKLKNHFSRYGSPDVVISDNGPQYSSEEFAKFSMSWDFEHRTSSPGNSKANGKAESAVKIAKNIIKKAIKAGEDVYLALLDYRNTPTQAMETSPAQRSLGRRTRTLIPTTESLLKPNFIDGKAAKTDIKRKQLLQQKYFNRKAKDLPPLQEGDQVRLKPFVKSKGEWARGTVVRKLDERSYDVQNEHGVVRRNRVHMKLTNERPQQPNINSHGSDPKPPTIPAPSEGKEISPSEVPTQSDAIETVSEPTSVKPTQQTTRSGRLVNKPIRYSE